MSRAFVNEDHDESYGGKRFSLPPRNDPTFDEAAARALLEAAREGLTGAAEQATGFYWGEDRLKPHVERILAQAVRDGDDRLEQLARRFLPQGRGTETSSRADRLVNGAFAIRRGDDDPDARPDGGTVGTHAFKFERDPVVTVPGVQEQRVVSHVARPGGSQT